MSGAEYNLRGSGAVSFWGVCPEKRIAI